jgi:hypothetical protein
MLMHMRLLERQAEIQHEVALREAEQWRLAHQAAPSPRWTFRLSAFVSPVVARLKTSLASRSESRKVGLPAPQNG